MAACQGYQTAGREYSASSCDGLCNLHMQCLLTSDMIHILWHSHACMLAFLGPLYICASKLLVTLKIKHTITAATQTKKNGYCLPSTHAMQLLHSVTCFSLSPDLFEVQNPQLGVSVS